MSETNKFFIKYLLILVGWIIFGMIAGVGLIVNNRGDGVHAIALVIVSILGLCTSEILLYNKNKDAIKSERKLYDAEQKKLEQARYQKEIERHIQ